MKAGMLNQEFSTIPIEKEHLFSDKRYPLSILSGMMVVEQGLRIHGLVTPRGVKPCPNPTPSLAQ
jgi:hypothetical protein